MEEGNASTVVILESSFAQIFRCIRAGNGTLLHTQIGAWDPRRYLTDEQGLRLCEEMVRQVNLAWTKSGGPTQSLFLSLPGRVISNSVVVSSSRLGITKSVPMSKTVEDALGVPTTILHDVECLAIGEALLAGSPMEDIALDYVLVDEGVGSKAVVNGNILRGAGGAGVLGRLTVQPDASYSREFSARGPLEVFCSRPWVSENLVAMYLSERNKRGFLRSDLVDTRFRRALEVMSKGDPGRGEWRQLDYSHIADGIASADPIALPVIDKAALYLGFAINCVIAILHPHRVILGGGMITELPSFADLSINYARQFCWANSWNEVDVMVSAFGRRAQIEGAVFQGHNR